MIYFILWNVSRGCEPGSQSLFQNVESNTGVWRWDACELSFILRKHQSRLRKIVDEHAGHIYRVCVCGASKVAITTLTTPEKIPKIKSMLEKLSASLLISKTSALINNFDQFEKNEPELQWFHYLITNFRDLIGLDLVKSSLFLIFKYIF